MKSQIKLGTVFGVELGLHYSWLVIALLITFSLVEQFHAANPRWTETAVWSTAILTGLLFFACLFAHELSHALVARARGLPIHKITLFLLGGVAQLEKDPTDPKTEFSVAIAGPITSAVLGFILIALAGAAGWTWNATPRTPGTALLVWLGYINFALAAFNLIPGFPLDGGRVLRAILWWTMGSAQRSTRVAARVGQAIAVIFIAYGVLRFFAGAGLGGLWLAFIGWFMLQAASASYLQIRTTTLLNGLKAKDLMSSDYGTVDPNTTVQELVNEQLLRTGRRCFFVVKNGRLLGLITPQEVRAIDPQIRPFRRVGDAMRRADQIHFISPDMPALEALQTLSREDVNQLPVLSNGQIAGVITRGRLLEVLHSRAELSPPTDMPRAA
jgi:Zn-dependent protease/predicted transcriptional regulator